MKNSAPKRRSLGIVKVTFDRPETQEEKTARLTQERLARDEVARERLIELWEEESTAGEQEIIKHYLENNRSARFVAESQIPAVLNLGKNKLRKVVAIIKRYEEIEAALRKRKGRG